MVQLQHTSVEQIEHIHKTLYKTFKAGKCRPISYRREQLLQLARMMQENAEDLATAIHKDLQKPRQESYGFEIGPIIERSLISAKNLEEWSKPEKPEVPDWQKPWSPTIYKAPKGPVLVVAPWNYPLVLSLQSLIAAIAAGCPAVIKPSELVPNFSHLLAELFPKYLDRDAYVAVNGGVPETTKLLDLRWAHIFYTGNGRVGRIIASAAAKHLTPVSLELGGKSPVIIDGSYDIKLAAKRVLFGKTCNSGQTCIAPDYVLIPKEKQEELVQAFKDHVKEFYPQGALVSESYAGIVSEPHLKRLKGILDRTKGDVVIGGQVDEKKLRFEPTIVADVKDDDSLMEDEIFGPILPIVPVENLDEAIDFVNARDHPLAFYVFTDSQETKDKIRDETLSGSIVFNDTFQQLAVSEMPFSGVGESGYGYQILKYGFDGFTYLRSSMDMPKEAEPFLGIRYAPYTENSFKIMSASAFLPIPSSESEKELRVPN